MNQKVKTALCMYTAVMLFGIAAILGRCSAQTASAAIQTAAQQYAQANPETADNTAELISAAESRVIAEVIEAERQYEQMDYQFFNGDAEAYANRK